MSRKSKFNRFDFFFATVVLVATVPYFVLPSAVAHKCVFLGPLPMFLEHQHPLVVGVGRCSSEKKSNSFTFGLGLLHLLLRQTLAAPEPCMQRGKQTIDNKGCYRGE